MSSNKSHHEADPNEISKAKDSNIWKFKPRAFSIVWGSDKGFWNVPEKETDGPAELLQVCWLEVKGSSPEPLSKGARYALSFKISLTENKFGWGEAPAFMMAKVGKKGRAKWARINLGDVEENTEMEVPFGKLRFEVPSNAEDTILNFGLYELWTGGWKGGLLIHEAMSSNKPHHDADPDEILKEADRNIWTFKPRGFNIIWGSDRRYWNVPEKGIVQPAELLKVCWLEVTGTTTESLPKGKYEIIFKLQVKQGAFGLYDSPIFMMAKVGKRGRYKWRKIKLPQTSDSSPAPTDPFQIEVDETREDNKLYFGLYEVWNGKWKGGLLIHEATVRPVLNS
uniref:Protein PHLOEM PROTEIN 2-LIKE A9-like n=1 Tax=Salix viminalis TaxID=40686 RepID=A0A6N2MJU5_SALVM